MFPENKRKQIITLIGKNNDLVLPILMWLIVMNMLVETNIALEVVFEKDIFQL